MSPLSTQRIIFLWTLVAAGIVFHQIALWRGGVPIETDLLSLLPSDGRDETAEQVRAFEDRCEEEILDGLQVPGARLHMKYRGRVKDRTEQYDRVDDRGVVRTVEEQGLRFEVNLSDYLDTGLFLDHRKTRSIIRH